MASLFSGVRKYGLGLTVAHQDLHQLHATAPEVERSLLANAYTRICFRLGEADARQMQNSFSFFDAEDLMSLGLGEAICRVGPRSADFNLRTEALSGLEAGEAARRVKSIRRHSADRWGVPIDVVKSRAAAAEPAPADSDRGAELSSGTRPGRRRIEPEQSTQRKPDKATLDYLESVAAEPFLQVRQRNERVGLSGWKGQQIKRASVEAGWAKEVTINPGGRGKKFKLVELTAEGRRLLLDFGVTPKEGLGRGGIAHQWWAETIAAWIEEQGAPARIEDESAGARVDIVALARRKRIAIEIEMGTGHVVENIKKDVDAGFDSVVSLLDDPRSIERVEERLSKVLGEPPRSILIMGDIRDFAALLSPLLFPQPPPLAARGENGFA